MSEVVYYTDNNEDKIPVFRTAVKAIGGKLETFKTGNKLMHAIDNPPPNPKMVFVDVDNNTDGYKIVEKIRNAENGKLPIVIISESSNNRTVKKYRALGANLYIQKCLSRLNFKIALNYALNINWKTFLSSKNFFYNRFLNR